MALPVITRILTLRDIKVLHLEPTDVCQAVCALCARETDVEFNKHQKHHLTPVQILKHISEEQIRQLDKMFMCGNYGDPAAGKYTLDIYQWIRQLNPNIILGMNTNGALQTTFWWHAIGQLFNKSHDYVVFSIDGLEDTNSVYREGVKWSRLMANAEAFILAGGSAHWDMLVYKHNQHQVDQCEQLARDMGFKWFRVKVSKRPFTVRLQAPRGYQLPQVTQGQIKCRALDEQSMYIDAQGRASPCCWLGSRQSDFESDFEKIQLSWNTDPNSVCSKICKSSNQGSSFTNQWQREVELNV